MDGIANPAKLLENRQLGDSGSSSLRTLLALIERQVKQLEDDLKQLWDDQFVATANEWSSPYVGVLVSIGLLTLIILWLASRRRRRPHLRRPYRGSCAPR